jgi:hypothetical protein
MLFLDQAENEAASRMGEGALKVLIQNSGETIIIVG